MKLRILQSPVVVLSLVAVAFLAGRALDGRDGGVVAAQDRDPPVRRDPPPVVTDPTTTPDDVLVYGEEGGVAAGANGILAVTGSYGVGTSVLYVIDTVNKQMAVYEARGGSRSMRRLVLVGARRIDLDLALEGYNDESEFDYRSLKRRFAGAGDSSGPVEPSTGLRESAGR
ncbi:MAG: hypothetical protein IPM29_12500 [Planctomycetes bacterium]|nr:hypothetical protein [Planctomycetota bacterium]